MNSYPFIRFFQKSITYEDVIQKLSYWKVSLELPGATPAATFFMFSKIHKFYTIRKLTVPGSQSEVAPLFPPALEPKTDVTGNIV